MSAPEAVPLSGGAVDLDQVARAKALETQERREAEERQVAAALNEFDRRMQRIFRGIIPRRERRRATVEALQRMSDGYTPPPTNDKKPRSRGGGPYYR